MHAVRNIRLCTKDCLCLYVCPTGATDTETGQIDADKCLDGCRACVDACPSHAISLVPDEFPLQQEKTADVVNALSALAESKSEQEKTAASISGTSEYPVERRLAEAFRLSNRLMAEDFLRESGYLLPQGDPVQTLLQSLLDVRPSDDFPADAAKKLKALLKGEDIANSPESGDSAPAEKYECTVCGYVHEDDLSDGFVCPVCGADTSVFVKK